MRDAEEDPGFLGDGRATGGANAAENVGLGFVFEGVLDDFVGEGDRGVLADAAVEEVVVVGLAD